MESIQAEIINIIVLLVAGMMGFVAKYVTSFLKKKGILSQLQSNKELVNIVVNAVEQTYKHLDGKEKLAKAKIDISELAKSKGLQITAKELDLLIEASVKEMKKSVNQEIKPL